MSTLVYNKNNVIIDLFALVSYFQICCGFVRIHHLQKESKTEKELEICFTKIFF